MNALRRIKAGNLKISRDPPKVNKLRRRTTSEEKEDDNYSPSYKEEGDDEELGLVLEEEVEEASKELSLRGEEDERIHTHLKNVVDNAKEK